MAKDLSKMRPSKVANQSSSSDIAAFLTKAKARAGGARGGLIFALDATMSRQHTWDQAQHYQAEMFNAVEDVGGLDVQLVYFRGFGECRASRWVNEPSVLRKLMNGIDCRGGKTQIGKVLNHVRKETDKLNQKKTSPNRVGALVFVGDAMEENADELCDTAGQLGLLGVPCFMFQEGNDGMTERAFREIARLSNGAFMRFGGGSAAGLAELLKAVARFVSGGKMALETNSSREARLLLEQLK